MDAMSGILALLLCFQDPVQQQIDESLRQFETADELDRALTLLSAQLLALGAQATNPIARRLAQDLRDGMASSAAPAFIDALVGRPDALAPLQTAFQDATTTAAGRIELAEALLQLDDAMSWRAGLIGIASDERASLADLAGPEHDPEEPRVRIIDDRPRAFSEPPLHPFEKKSETRRETFITMPSILAGGVTLVLLGLLLVEILRKG